MKKLFLVSAIALVSVASVNAQGAQFGITAGLNLSNAYGDDVENTDMKAGFQAGVVVDLALSENFSIVPELLFSQRGDKVEGIGGYDVTLKETLNYLQLPINAMYKVPVANDSKLLLFAGSPTNSRNASFSNPDEIDFTPVQAGSISNPITIKNSDFFIFLPPLCNNCLIFVCRYCPP